MHVHEKRLGRLSGYRLAFNQPGIPYLEPCFANLRADRHDEVHGVLWKISTDDFARLDLQEGGGDAYDRLIVRVETDSERLSARTYITQQVVEGLRPSRRYRDLLVEGAMEAGLDAAYVSTLSQSPVYDVPGLSRFSPLLMRVIEKAFERGLNPKRLFDLYWGKRRGS